MKIISAFDINYQKILASYRIGKRYNSVKGCLYVYRANATRNS